MGKLEQVFGGGIIIIIIITKLDYTQMSICEDES